MTSSSPSSFLVTPARRRAIGLLVLVPLWIASACAPEKEPATHAGQVEAHEPTTSLGEHGELIVFVDAEHRPHMGLETAPVTRSTSRPTREAYGRLVADPSGAFVLRARVSGTVRAAAGATWPTQGASIAAGTTLGWIEPRLTPQERGDLAARLATARADVANAKAELPALRTAVERARALNADKTVSDRALQEAEAKVTTAEARANGAEQLVHALESASQVSANAESEQALRVETAGHVVELAVHPGESVEAGSVIVRVEDLSRVLARVELPVDGSVAPDVATADVALVGTDAIVRGCPRVAPITTSDSLTPEAFFRVAMPDANAATWLRAGSTVVARLATRSAAREGFVAPNAAVVRLGGRAWVYVPVDDEHFARREVVLDVPVDGGWLVDAEWARAPDVALVVRGAAQLLSFELLGVQSAVGSEDEH